MKKIIADFKKFISKGNVLDMAIGLIIGSAFTAIVTSLSNGILKPLINWLIAVCSGGDASALENALTFLKKAYDSTGAVDLANSIYIDWGALISAIINFLLIAIVLFAILKATMAAKGMISSKYFGYDKAQYKAFKKSGKTKKEIELMAKERDAQAEAQSKATAEEAKKHTTEALLEDIKIILQNSNKTQAEKTDN